MSLLFTSFKDFEKEFYNESFWSDDFKASFLSDSINTRNYVIAKGYTIIVAFVNDHFDRTCLKYLATNGLKHIALRCAGFNNIDLKAAKEFGISVSRVPSYSPEAIAQFSLGLLLNMLRKIHISYTRTRDCNFSLNHLVGENLNEKTVAVIGTGKIGKIFCQYLYALGAKPIAVDPLPDKDLIQMGITYLPLLEACKRADIVSLHLPLTKETEHLFDSNVFSCMKDGVYFMNTSRGGLVDTKALIQALKAKKLKAVALDVYEEEEKVFFEDHSFELIEDEDIYRLTSFPNVLISSHQAFLTKESLQNIAKTVKENLLSYSQEEKGANFLG
jgi:D-lactate dehydrogenase